MLPRNLAYNRKKSTNVHFLNCYLYIVLYAEVPYSISPRHSDDVISVEKPRP